MNINQIYECQPWLRRINMYGISDRLKQYGITIAYNTRRDSYELHGCRPDFDGRNSCNDTIPVEALNGSIVTDFRANEVRRFAEEIDSYFGNNNQLYDKHEDIVHKSNLSRAMQTARRVLV